MTYVIGFNGPPKSGKDTAALMARSFLAEQGYTPLIMKYAYPLKKAINAFLYDYNLADAEENTLKDQELAAFPAKHVTLRDMYIRFSEVMVKPVLGIDAFGVIMAKRIAGMRYIPEVGVNVVLISDCGFAPEQEPVIDLVSSDNYALIQMHREGTDFSIDSRSYIEPARGTTVALSNNGTMQELRSEVISTITKLIREKHWTNQQ